MNIPTGLCICAWGQNYATVLEGMVCTRRHHNLDSLKQALWTIFLWMYRLWCYIRANGGHFEYFFFLVCYSPEWSLSQMRAWAGVLGMSTATVSLIVATWPVLPTILNAETLARWYAMTVFKPRNLQIHQVFVNMWFQLVSKAINLTFCVFTL